MTYIKPKKNIEVDELLEIDGITPIKPKSNTIFNPGWQCPSCGRGNAPNTRTCPCVPLPIQITYL
jgi:hypothetical protein